VLARAQDIIEPARLEPGYGLGRDHATVGDDADPANAEALAQAVDNRQQHGTSAVLPGHISEQTGHPAPSMTTDDHLPQVGPQILRIAILAQALAALAFER
jgi:hypothetical protein